jgi:excisionase family DNA binding protein
VAALALLDEAERADAAPETPDRHVDACAYLKDALPKRRVLGAARSGEFPATKVGRRWICRASDLDAWLSKQTAEPSEAPTALARWQARRLAS